MKHVIVLASLFLTIVGCGLSFNGSPRASEVDTVTEFIQAVAAGDDGQATTYLSQNAQTAVSTSCPNGSVTACFDAYGRQKWGNLRKVFWQAGLPDGSSAYTTVWDNDVILIVFKSNKNDNGIWEIDGWRGAVSDKPDGWSDSIITGTNSPNQFPPTAQP